MNISHLKHSSLVLLLILMNSCQSSRTQFWIDMYEGEIVTTESIIEDLKESQIVFIGESHRIARHHAWQRKILKELHISGTPISLGLEMIEKHYQPALDKFNAGQIDFETLAKEIDWKNRWSNYLSYRELVEYAQQHAIPVLGLNGRTELIRQVGRQGLTSLSQEQQNEIPPKINWQNDTIYRNHLDKIMLVHMSVDSSRLEKIFQAQVLRDEIMADVIVNHLKSNPNHHMMVVTGSGHINYGLGTVQRVRRELPAIRDRIVLFTVSGDLTLTPQEQQQVRPITITHQQLREIPYPLSDYLLVTEPEDGIQ